MSIAFPTPQGDEVTVVQSVSFDVGRGEAVGLVGESGCGKTVTGLGVLGLLARRSADHGGSDLHRW